ncbi:hypothetical protein [Mesorhizobium sp. B2-4-6]|uniref:hypothetical protein n=1 Tax=Mesorhizobium sp. B2-4-6 TaxID=2589943 RepID=UPI00112BA031|nr:hypothetical protein [Mesorhizobium sp. B2-4-6]TPL40633.1 hypothetical protein FJ957_25725 [Mesorhizobium sp. B2-4-6]
MKPQIIHRFTIPLTLAIEHLVGKAETDGEAYLVTVEDDEIVIDIMGPVEREIIAAPSIETPAEDPPAKPERKGGRLAAIAGTICGEGAFWKFIAEKYGTRVDGKDGAATWLRAQCGIASRTDLDHEPLKAENFREIEKSYRLWLEGYD